MNWLKCFEEFPAFKCFTWCRLLDILTPFIVLTLGIIGRVGHHPKASGINKLGIRHKNKLF